MAARLQQSQHVIVGNVISDNDSDKAKTLYEVKEFREGVFFFFYQYILQHSLHDIFTTHNLGYGSQILPHTI